jgi:hypothetical protein
MGGLMMDKLELPRTEAIGADLSALEEITARRDSGHGAFDGGPYDGCGWRDPESALARGAQPLSSRALSVVASYAAGPVLISPRLIQSSNSRQRLPLRNGRGNRAG